MAINLFQDRNKVMFNIAPYLFPKYMTLSQPSIKVNVNLLTAKHTHSFLKPPFLTQLDNY